MCSRCELRRVMVDRILHDDLHLQQKTKQNKIMARWIPELLTKDKKKRRFFCVRRNYPKSVDFVARDNYAMLPWETKRCLSFHGIESKRTNRKQMGEKCPDANKSSYTLPETETIYFCSSGLATVDILPEKFTLTATYCVISKTVISKVM